jgi:hypothetical protein
MGKTYYGIDAKLAEWKNAASVDGLPPLDR